MEDSWKIIARALKNSDITHIFASMSDYDFMDAFIQEDIEVIRCLQPSSPAYAAAAYSRIKGLGIFLETSGSLEGLRAICGSSFNDSAVIGLLHYNQEDEEYLQKNNCFQVCLGNDKDAHMGIDDAISAAIESSSPVFLCVRNGALGESNETAPTKSMTPVLKKKRIAAREGKNGSSRDDVIDLVMASIKSYFSAEEIILMSEMPCLKTEFLPTSLYVYGRNNETGWSVGATIGYAMAAKEKRPITCMTDLSFQSMAGEISTMLKISCNAIIILLDTSNKNVVRWDYSAIIEAMDKGQLKSWSTMVHTERRLQKAIRTANRVHKNKLCLIDVMLENSISSERTFENYRGLFCENSQENDDDVKQEKGFCVICFSDILNKECVVSYTVCTHIFHNVCLDEMFRQGHNICPLDRIPLDGPSERWIFHNHEAPDDETSEFEGCLEPMHTISGVSNIETCCSRCNVPYALHAYKISLMCSHTCCTTCYVLMDRCCVCGGDMDPHSMTVVEEVEEVLPLAPVLAVAAPDDGLHDHEMDIEADEDPVDEDQPNTLAELHDNELNAEADEELADFQYELSVWFWQGR